MNQFEIAAEKTLLTNDNASRAGRKIAAANGVSTAVVALSWLVNFYGDTVVAIPGATKVSQVEQNATALQLKLSEKEMSHIDQLSSKFRRMIPLG